MHLWTAVESCRAVPLYIVGATIHSSLIRSVLLLNLDGDGRRPLNIALSRPVGQTGCRPSPMFLRTHKRALHAHLDAVGLLAPI